jgi:hypothetical protein
MAPNPNPVKSKITFDEGVLAIQGEFINFSTHKVEPEVLADRPVKRFYKNRRIELHTPCEHEGKAPCSLELQFYCEETIDYTDPMPADKITNLGFSLFFDESDKGKYFTDVWTVKVGDKTVPFFLALDDKDNEINKDSEFEIPIM